MVLSPIRTRDGRCLELIGCQAFHDRSPVCLHGALADVHPIGNLDCSLRAGVILVGGRRFITFAAIDSMMARNRNRRSRRGRGMRHQAPTPPTEIPAVQLQLRERLAAGDESARQTLIDGFNDPFALGGLSPTRRRRGLSAARLLRRPSTAGRKAAMRGLETLSDQACHG